MHKEFKKLLNNATGISDFIIAINLDIRGFSSFSMEVESPAVALFIGRVYRRVIDNYFPKASFFKPTGDGLLIIMPYTEKNLQKIARKVIDSCFSILRDFGSICANDPMINFDVPRRIGIGMSRGVACRLTSKGKILDYSGRALNLASRLMDLARPSGVVFDADFGIELFTDQQIAKFAKDSVYIKGIAEKEAINIYYTKELTTISLLNKQQIEKINWGEKKDKKTLKQIKDLRPNFVYTLPTEPRDREAIKVKITHPCVVRGRKRKAFLTEFDFSNFEYIVEGEEKNVTIEFDALAKRLETKGIKDSWDIEIKIIYPER